MVSSGQAHLRVHDDPVPPNMFGFLVRASSLDNLNLEETVVEAAQK